MKIAFVTFEYPPFIIGGAGIYALNVTRELAELGHQIIVFTPDILEGNSESDASNLEIRKIPVNKKIPFKALQFWLCLPNEIKNFENHGTFDIIHFNGLSYWFLKKRVSKAKHVVTVHHLVKDAIKNNNLSFISRMKDISGENNLFMPFLEKKYIKSPDKLVAVSNFTKKQIVESYDIDPDKIEVIYNGTDLNGYLFPEEEIITIKKEICPNESPVILFVGRIDDPRKGLDFLLNSLVDVLKKIDVTLLVVGKGDINKVKNFAESLGISKNIVFTGFVDECNLKKYYSLCDIYVCPSRLEGFGLTILEAMAAGKPIVATKVGAIPEILANDINGILVESENTSMMSSAICTLLENRTLFNDLKINNSICLDGKFDWHKCANELLNVYNQQLVNK